MTPQQIEEAARRRYNSADSTFWTQDEVFKIIYEAETILAVEADVIEGVDTSVSTAIGTLSYSLPADCQKVKRVEYNGLKLKPVTMREDDALTMNNSITTSTGTPQYYFVWNSTMYLRPIPDAVVALRIYQYELPALLTTASTTMSVPTRCHARIVDFVVAEMASKDENFNKANYHSNRWEQYLARERAGTKKLRRGDSFASVQDEESLSQTILGFV